MTVVNALKFNEYSGAMCCDEQTTIGEVRKMMSSDKIQKIVPTKLRENLLLEAVYGGTGTTAIGDEVRRGVKRRLWDEYEQMLAKSKENPKHYKTIDDIVQIGFEEMMKVKHRHINDIVKGYFNFDTNDYTQGFYKDKDGEKISIEQKELKTKVYNLMNWKDADEVDSIFLNAAIICGFDYRQEFKIYKLSMKTEMNMELAPSIFETVGSGSDSAQIVFAAYANTKTLDERRHNIDRVEGIIQLIRATNAAAKFNMGVGGYFNIVLFDAKEEDINRRFVEIFDNRSKLASEIVQVLYGDFISEENTSELVDELIFKRNKTFDEVNRAFLSASKDKFKMMRYLRGYKG